MSSTECSFSLRWIRLSWINGCRIPIETFVRLLLYWTTVLNRYPFRITWHFCYKTFWSAVADVPYRRLTSRWHRISRLITVISALDRTRPRQTVSIRQLRGEHYTYEICQALLAPLTCITVLGVLSQNVHVTQPNEVQLSHVYGMCPHVFNKCWVSYVSIDYVLSCRRKIPLLKNLNVYFNEWTICGDTNSNVVGFYRLHTTYDVARNASSFNHQTSSGASECCLCNFFPVFSNSKDFLTYLSLFLSGASAFVHLHDR